LMAALKANVIWFPRERLPLVNGCTAAFGMLGALFSTVPVEFLLQFTSWRMIFGGLAVLALCCALVILLLVPEKESRAPSSGLRQQIDDLAEIYGSGFFWRISILVVIHNAVYQSYQSLWL